MFQSSFKESQTVIVTYRSSNIFIVTYTGVLPVIFFLMSALWSVIRLHKKQVLLCVSGKWCKQGQPVNPLTWQIQLYDLVNMTSEVA